MFAGTGSAGGGEADDGSKFCPSHPGPALVLVVLPGPEQNNKPDPRSNPPVPHSLIMNGRLRDELAAGFI
jgi:hypothetical protein